MGVIRTQDMKHVQFSYRQSPLTPMKYTKYPTKSQHTAAVSHTNELFIHADPEYSTADQT